jgi:hypothetical protein
MGGGRLLGNHALYGVTCVYAAILKIGETGVAMRFQEGANLRDRGRDLLLAGPTPTVQPGPEACAGRLKRRVVSPSGQTATGRDLPPGCNQDNAWPLESPGE